MTKSKLFSAIGIEVDGKPVRQTLKQENPLWDTVKSEGFSTFYTELEYRKNYFKIVSGIYNKPLSAKLLKELEHIASDSKSEDEKIISAYKILNDTRMPQTAEILRLLRDNSIETKRLGIFLIGKFRIKDMISEVCSCLNIKELETDAYSVLNAFGTDAERELERFFLASSGNSDTSKIVLKLIGNQNTAESKSFIFSRLWSNSRQLKETAVKLLIDSDFKPTQDEKDKLHQIISETIGVIVWNLATQLSIEKHADKPLRNAVIAEINRHTDYLFDILSITYDKSFIEKIRENLKSGTVRAAVKFLKTTDIAIDKITKQKLVMLVDAVSIKTKLKNLYQFYPVSIQDYSNTLEDIINRDYNLVEIWTKACALRNVKGVDEETIMQSVAALMFSPEEILREESVKVNAALYGRVSKRLPESLKIKLDKIANGEISEKELLFEKTSFLSKCFGSIPEYKILALAARLKYCETFTENLENVIILPCSNDNAKKIIMHYEGKFNKEIQPFYALPMATVYNFDFYYPEWSAEIIKYLKTNVL